MKSSTVAAMKVARRARSNVVPIKATPQVFETPEEQEIKRLRLCVAYLGGTLAGSTMRKSIANRALQPGSTYTPGVR